MNARRRRISRIRRRQRAAYAARRSEYARWIASYVARSKTLAGGCMRASSEMASIFTELSVVHGYVYANGDVLGHVWCIDNRGIVADPTAAQFSKIEKYEANIVFESIDEVRP